jgi:hypothetical protein
MYERTTSQGTPSIPTCKTLHTWLRERMQELVQWALEAEVRELLGRARYQRRAEADALPGYWRHLYRKSPPTDGPGCYLRKLSTPVGMVTQQPSSARLTRSGSVAGYWRCLPGGPADAPDHRVRAQPEGGGASAEGVRGMVRKAGLPAGRRDPGAALEPDGDLLPVPPGALGTPPDGERGRVPLCGPAAADGRGQALQALRRSHLGDMEVQRRFRRPLDLHHADTPLDGTSVTCIALLAFHSRRETVARLRTTCWL